MNRFKVAAAAVALAIALAALASVGAPPREARAQGFGGSDTWSGHDEPLVTVQTTVAGTALIFTAVTSPNRGLTVKSFTATNSTAAVVAFRDGASGNYIGNFYFAANTPQQIPEYMLGQGMKTTSGNGLYATSSGGVLTITARVRRE